MFCSDSAGRVEWILRAPNAREGLAISVRSMMRLVCRYAIVIVVAHRVSTKMEAALRRHQFHLILPPLLRVVCFSELESATLILRLNALIDFEPLHLALYTPFNSTPLPPFSIPSHASGKSSITTHQYCLRPERIKTESTPSVSRQTYETTTRFTTRL